MGRLKPRPPRVPGKSSGAAKNPKPEPKTKVELVREILVNWRMAAAAEGRCRIIQRDEFGKHSTTVQFMEIGG